MGDDNKTNVENTFSAHIEAILTVGQDVGIATAIRHLNASIIALLSMSRTLNEYLAEALKKQGMN